jgi:hypothetical protein
MALAGGGEFTTLPVSTHFQSHTSIIETFLDAACPLFQRMGSFVQGLASEVRNLACFEICRLSRVSELIDLGHG